ncbi:hypothetical protein AVEN_170447-1, partial [Araneus ventricosus]
MGLSPGRYERVMVSGLRRCVIKAETKLYPRRSFHHPSPEERAEPFGFRGLTDPPRGELSSLKETSRHIELVAVLSSTELIDKSRDYSLMRPWIGNGLIT